MPALPWIALLALTLFIDAAQAQPTAPGGPTRQVRIVTPFAAGGSADVLARITGQALSARWNQPGGDRQPPLAPADISAPRPSRGAPGTATHCCLAASASTRPIRSIATCPTARATS
jgi:hypothetical protein